MYYIQDYGLGHRLLGEVNFLPTRDNWQDGGVKGYVLIFSWENSKITTCCWATMDRRMLDPTKKNTPCPGAKEKPQKDDRRGEITFRIKDHTHQRCSEGSKKKKLVHTRIKRSHRGMLDLCLNLLKRYGSAVTCHRGKGSGCSYLGHTACGISPLGGGHH